MKTEIIRISIKCTYNKPTDRPTNQAPNMKPQPKTLNPNPYEKCKKFIDVLSIKTCKYNLGVKRQLNGSYFHVQFGDDAPKPCKAGTNIPHTGWTS